MTRVGPPRATSVVALCLLITLTGLAQERDRAKIPDKYKWDLTQIYESEGVWREAKDKIAAEIPESGNSGVL